MKKIRGNRKSARITVRDLQLKIGPKVFNVFNLSAGGVGFLLDSPADFPVGKELTEITLEMNPPLQVTGTTRHVSHISEIDDDADVRSEWICGIEFLSPEDPTQKRVIQQTIETYLKAAA